MVFVVVVVIVRCPNRQACCPRALLLLPPPVLILLSSTAVAREHQLLFCARHFAMRFVRRERGGAGTLSLAVSSFDDQLGTASVESSTRRSIPPAIDRAVAVRNNRRVIRAWNILACCYSVLCQGLGGGGHRCGVRLVPGGDSQGSFRPTANFRLWYVQFVWSYSAGRDILART